MPTSHAIPLPSPARCFPLLVRRSAATRLPTHALRIPWLDGCDPRKIVILSHSMGGLLTRSAVTDLGTALYDADFGTPFDQLKASTETRELIREGLPYEPYTDPARVVFMAVPQRGSPMANFRGTAFISKLIRLPKTLTIGILDTTARNLDELLDASAESETARPPTSISERPPENEPVANLGLWCGGADSKSKPNTYETKGKR